LDWGILSFSISFLFPVKTKYFPSRELPLSLQHTLTPTLNMFCDALDREILILIDSFIFTSGHIIYFGESLNAWGRERETNPEKQSRNENRGIIIQVDFPWEVSLSFSLAVWTRNQICKIEFVIRFTDPSVTLTLLSAFLLWFRILILCFFNFIYNNSFSHCLCSI